MRDWFIFLAPYVAYGMSFASVHPLETWHALQNLLQKPRLFSLWRCSQALLLYLREAVDDVKDIETKLHEGKAMSDAQRRLYDEAAGAVRATHPPIPFDCLVSWLGCPNPSRSAVALSSSRCHRKLRRTRSWNCIAPAGARQRKHDSLQRLFAQPRLL